MSNVTYSGIPYKGQAGKYSLSLNYVQMNELKNG